MALLWMPAGPEWIVILVALLLLFGATRVPQLMRGLGQGVREFKKALNDDEPAAAPEISAEEKVQEKPKIETKT
jgi:sec-independent protein translocase protein TatA